MSHPEPRPERRDRAATAALIAVMAYGFAIVAAGHGIVPVGLLLFWGPAQGGLLAAGALLGWVGIIAFAGGFLLRADRRARYGIYAGLVLMAASLFPFMAFSDAPPITMITGFPFVLAAVWLLKRLHPPAAEVAHERA